MNGKKRRRVIWRSDENLMGFIWIRSVGGQASWDFKYFAYFMLRKWRMENSHFIYLNNPMHAFEQSKPKMTDTRIVLAANSLRAKNYNIKSLFPLTNCFK